MLHIFCTQELRICKAIEDDGFEAKSMEDSSNNTSFQICRIHIGGMTCTSCTSAAESTLYVWICLYKSGLNSKFEAKNQL
jgi:Cu+-exporting ATPase